MSDGALFLVGVGVLLIVLGVVAVTRRQPLPRGWQPGDKISLIEAGMSAADPNFVPAGEMRWEQHVNRFLCWFGLLAGVALVAVGLWYGQNS